ncbi:ribonuclease 3-like [Gossypium arboreum]|uniref:Uncharacterized protein n=1 Tax=Gossypium arboreum TaxID=29729 RepID=A0ABR0NJP1_GOSAR|nr:ribonuclease 3-like [Gossypium arboreum]KAK5794897.1 hypothetical protein PVK06_036149 [Gossypium arboreum]
MQKRQILVVAVVLAGVSLVVSDEDVKPLDFYKYSLQWGPTVCLHPPPGKKCEGRAEVRFTIHGLWPQYYKDTPVPPYHEDPRCTNTKPTSENDVVEILKKSTLKADLMRNWPNLYARKVRKEEDNLQFWKYEWGKHGMCSDYPNKPSDYFSFTLNLLQEFINLKEDLGFKRGSKVGDILKNLRDKNYKQPQIVCNSESQLLEIRFCYKEKKAFDCPSWAGSKTACKTETANIFLPGGAGGTDAMNYYFSHELGVGSRTCNAQTANIFLPDGARGTDSVYYNFSHDGGNY